MIGRVERPDDPLIADYARVGDPAWLHSNGLFVAEGRLVVERLLAASRFRVRSLLLTPTALEALPDVLGPSHTFPVFVAPQQVLNAVTGFNFHRGCLGLAECPADTAVQALVGAQRILALEGVSNPDNMGGLFRVAAAFGVQGILLDGASGDPLYRKAVRTSMGAALTVPFARAKDWPGALTRLRGEGYTLIALTPRSDAPALDEVKLPGGLLVVMVGAEGSGLSDGTLRAADRLVRIPMAEGFDSLNVVVAAGVALSHLP